MQILPEQGKLRHRSYLDQDVRAMRKRYSWYDYVDIWNEERSEQWLYHGLETDYVPLNFVTAWAKVCGWEVEEFYRQPRGSNRGRVHFVPRGWSDLGLLKRMQASAVLDIAYIDRRWWVDVCHTDRFFKKAARYGRWDNLRLR